MGPNYFETSLDPRDGLHGWKNLQKIASIKFLVLIILKIHNIFFIKSAIFGVFVLQCTQREYVYNWNGKSLYIIIFFIITKYFHACFGAKENREMLKKVFYLENNRKQENNKLNKMNVYISLFI